MSSLIHRLSVMYNILVHTESLYMSLDPSMVLVETIYILSINTCDIRKLCIHVCSYMTILII